MSQSPVKIMILLWTFSRMHAIATNNVIAFNANDLNGGEFRSVPTTVKTYENDTVLLPCDHKFSYNSIRWLKESDLIVDALYADEVLIKHYRLLSNGSLEVINVQPDDTGKYVCEIIAETIKGRQSHYIEVQYAPRVYITPNGFIELPLGTVLEVDCITEGVPQPAVIWTHNNKTVIDYAIDNHQSYIVEIHSRNVSGIISCTANNGVGHPVSDSIELSVLFTPEVRAIQKVFYAKIGARIQLECLVESAPLAKIKWWHDGRSINFNNHNYARLDLDVPLNGSHPIRYYYSLMRHLLIIKNVRDSDMGMYECRAENSIGVRSAYMELTFRPMPCMFKISPTDIKDPTAHLLVWQTESYAPIIEFKLKFRSLSSDQSKLDAKVTKTTSKIEWTALTIPADLSIGPIYTTSFTLYGLNPTSIYEAVVFARNYFGWSDTSKILRFTTGGEVQVPYESTENNPVHHNDDESGNYITNDSNTNQTISDMINLNRTNFKFDNETLNADYSNENALYSGFNVRIYSNAISTITAIDISKHFIYYTIFFIFHILLLSHF